MKKLSSTQASVCINDHMAPYLSKKKLGQLLTLMSMAKKTGEISLARGLHAIAPGKSRKQRFAALEGLADKMVEASRLIGALVLLRYDKGKAPKRGVDHRQIWLEGDVAACALSQRNAAFATKPGATLKSKQVVRCFVIWSQAPEPRHHAKDLLMRAQRHLNCAKRFHFVIWSAEDIPAGAQWHEEIQSTISVSELALVLISPELLGSDYIKEFELPQYISSDGGTPTSGKTAVPVALTPFDMDGNRSELLGLEHRQIFFGEVGGKRIAYSQCRNLRERDEFALQLAKRILQLVEQKFGS